MPAQDKKRQKKSKPKKGKSRITKGVSRVCLSCPEAV
jgi:hypothetical protein